VPLTGDEGKSRREKKRPILRKKKGALWLVKRETARHFQRDPPKGRKWETLRGRRNSPTRQTYG